MQYFYCLQWNGLIFCGQDYATALDLMQELILSTDLAEHVKVIKHIEQMVEGVCLHMCLLYDDKISIIESLM